MDDKEPFRVIEEKPGCSHCNTGALYMVVFDEAETGEECGTSTSYGGPGVTNDEARDAAQEVADELNHAYLLALDHKEHFPALCESRVRAWGDKEVSPSADSVVKP